jgi:hypothetical protein
MLNSNVVWPAGGELDIMEHIGREPGRLFSSVHTAEYRHPRTGPERWPFDKAQFLILNIAVGGDLGGAVDDAAFPVSMEVEHVRVHRAPPP